MGKKAIIIVVVIIAVVVGVRLILAPQREDNKRFLEESEKERKQLEQQGK